MNDPLQDLLGSVSPEAMEQIQRMAQSLFGGGEEAPQGKAKQGSPADGDFAIDPETLMRLSAILNRRRSPDSRSVLIEAIKPHLTEPHRKKADQALGFLRAMELIPLLKEAGL